MKKYYVDFMTEDEIHVKTFTKNYTEKTIENSTQQIESNEIEKITFPPYCFGFQIYSQDKAELNSPKTESETFYIGRAVSIYDVRNIFGETSDEFKNMRKTLTQDEMPVIGAAGNLVQAKKTSKVINPRKLPEYPHLFLSSFDEIMKKLPKDRTL